MGCGPVSGKNNRHKSHAGTRRQNQIRPPRGGRAKLNCQDAAPRPGRQEGAETDQAATRRPSQLRLPRDGRARSGRARSGSHEAVEGERGGGAGSGGVLAQKDIKRRETGLSGGPVIVCAKH
jgi:hypothetical protein